MNKKGITIPVVIVIVISMGLLFTGLYTYFNNEKKLTDEEKYQNQINLIIDSARIWVKENSINGDINITLCELEANNYIGILINPLTKQQIPNDSIIRYENGNYYFELGKNNLKTCSIENLYTYVELDVNDDNFVDIPIDNDNIKEIVIKENGNEVNRIYKNKKTTYEIIYILDNNEVKTKYLIVRDTTSPTINVNLNNYNYDSNTNTITVQKYANFVEPIATITDNSNNITNTSENNVDTYKVGNYELIYKAIDEDENETIKKINVVVKSNNMDENYYIDTDKFTNKKEITLKLKGINTSQICVSNNSICEEWIPYTETINWTIDENIQSIYVYYLSNNDVHLEKIDVYLDNQSPKYISSKKILFGPSYNLLDIINANDDISGIKNIYSSANKIYKPNNLGQNSLEIEIIDNANNKTNEKITITTYKNLKCDNSISSIVNEDGLIKDNNKCIFIGENPNNYITFNNELYRIISIENNDKLKIIKDESISKETYNKKSSNLETYYNNLKSNITTNDIFYYGDITKQDIVSNIYSENNSRYNNTNIGLLSITEYLKAGSCPTNTTFDKLATNNPCKQNNWLYNKNEYWLMNTTKNIPMYVTQNGNISYTYDSMKEIRPVLYLKANLGIIKGNGTKTDPYIIDESIEPTDLTCKIDTTSTFDTIKTLNVSANKNALISFDGINWSNNNKKDISNSGIITAYAKYNNDITSCSIRLYEEYEYRYKECSNNNKVYSSWHAKGSSKESSDYNIISKIEAENNYLNHYEVLESTPCNNCKWVTKYERTVDSCKSFDDSTWSNWSSNKPEQNNNILIDNPRIKYGIK